ncbi:MAG: hypothetical protein AUF76_10280 [Acidobacteria bacterium 13_1_20CM_2_65_9]|nr:MAG: hypothetical protein AUF76_10280 [Acidobacteria bacterium 13_1_20CM_2_65_9]
MIEMACGGVQRLGCTGEHDERIGTVAVAKTTAHALRHTEIEDACLNLRRAADEREVLEGMAFRLGQEEAPVYLARTCRGRREDRVHHCKPRRPMAE